MKTRKGGLLQRMMAVLLAAVLVVGMASNDVSMTVLAQEDTASLTPDGQTEIAEENTADTVEGDTEPEETDSEEEMPAPDKGTEEDTPEPEEETETNPEEAEEIRADEAGQDVQALLARIAALPNAEEYLATEPDAEDWAENEEAYEEAYTEWMAGLYEYADEALAIQEEVEKLTEEQRAQISEEELQKLAAWAEVAQTAGESAQMMLAAEPAPQADLPVTRDVPGNGWVLDADGKLTIASDAGMENWKKFRDTYKSDVTSVEIASGVTNIGDSAFFQCSGLKKVTILEGVKSIEYSAFGYCSSLTEITIPGSVESIGQSAFFQCSGLKKVTILEGVKSISIVNEAFGYCSSLTEITIPASVRDIGNMAFMGCTSLATVTMQGEPPTLGSDVFGTWWNGKDQRCGFVQNDTQGIRVPVGKAQTYKTAWTDWADYITEISSGNSGSGGNSDGSGSDRDDNHSDDNSDSDSGNNNNDNGGFAGDGNTYNDGGNNDSVNGSSGANAAIGSQSGANAVAALSKAPAAALATPQEKLEEAVLTAEEKQQKAAGADIRIELDVKAVAAEAAAADKALVEAALNGSLAKGYTLGQYLAISLYKVAGDSRTAVTETQGKITVRIAVPEGLKNTDSTKSRIFAVIRAHDGKAQLLADLDQDADTITIETDRFSTYAIVYKDMAAGGEENSVVRVSVEDGGKKSGGAKDDEPKTGDNTPLELSATLAMIAGFTYLLLYFTDRERGMTEETKKELVAGIVRWAKRGGRSRKYLALAAIFVLLVYYHSIGKKTCTEWKAIYGE